MSANTTRTEEQQAPDLKVGIVKRVAQVLVVLAVQTAILFLSSGRLDWAGAWVFIGLYLLGMVVNASLLLHYSPETIAERAEARGMKTWDKIVGGLFGIMYFIVMLLVAGLDVRFGWTGQFPLALHIAGTVAFALGFALLIWSMVSNAYFSTVVRVEEDRGQAVCDTGPYRFVRHPGYIGAIVHSLVVPLILGSWWALIPGALAALLMIARTALEDKTLQEELDGYQDYAEQVRYRLLPGIW